MGITPVLPSPKAPLSFYFIKNKEILGFSVVAKQSAGKQQLWPNVRFYASRGLQEPYIFCSKTVSTLWVRRLANS